jgi:hypothetical protein
MPHAFKAYPKHPTVLTLVQLHADLASQVIENKKHGEKLAEQVRSVEAVIKIFDPAFDLHRIAPRRRNIVNPWFRRGTMFRSVLDALRGAPGPLTTREITMRVFALKAVAAPTLEMIRHLESGVRSCLNHMPASRSSGWGKVCRSGGGSSHPGPTDVCLPGVALR